VIVDRDDLVEAHKLEKRLRVHACRRVMIGAGLLERSHGRSEGVDGSDGGDQGEDDYLGTKRLGLVVGERRGKTTGDDVDEDRLGLEGFDGLGEQIGSLDALDEADIGASVSGELETLDGLLHAKDLGGIRPRNDDEVALAVVNEVACLNGSAHACEELLAGDNRLSEQVSTALRLDLVLNVEGCEAGADVLLDGAGDVDGATEASISVRDDRDSGVDGGMHCASLNEIVQRGDGDIGLTKTRCRGSCATLVQAVEAGLEGAPSTQAITDTRGDDDTRTGKLLAEASGRVVGQGALEEVLGVKTRVVVRLLGREVRRLSEGSVRTGCLHGREDGVAVDVGGCGSADAVRGSIEGRGVFDDQIGDLVGKVEVIVDLNGDIGRHGEHERVEGK